MPSNRANQLKFNPKNILIEDQVIDINLKLYVFLKRLSNSYKITNKQLGDIQLKIYMYNNLIGDDVSKINRLKEIILEYVSKIKDQEKKENFEFIIDMIVDKNDFILFRFALNLTSIKPLILAEAQVVNYSRLIDQDIHPLSLAYDQLSINEPYLKRVRGALITYLFFDKISNNDLSIFLPDTHDYINNIIEEHEYLKNLGLSANQMFMLMFSQSMNQSITSRSGSHYEKRILDVLIAEGIPKETITKKHDEKDTSTEFDFFFVLENKQYGISAKRTLRERYKQFIKTTQMSKVDVMLQVTLGIDLSSDKVNAIRNHNVYLFVADEIYQSYQYLQNTIGVFPVTELTQENLLSLS